MRNDPLPVFCFKVDIRISTGGVAEAFFKSVSGLKYDHEVVPHRPGGTNDYIYQLVGAPKMAPLVFKQGFTGNSSLLKWREEWLTGTKSRADGTIKLLDTALTAKAQWSFREGWPIKWEISEFDASKSELAIETLEIAHEGLKFSAL